MRSLLLSVSLLATVASLAMADDTRTTLGDIPRTYSHYLNAQDAALCGANAATGGLSSFFLNPAGATEVREIAGQATVRYNSTSRDYLPGGDAYLDSSESSFLFSQFAAVRTSGAFTLGFGYSTPSYRSLELSGKIEDDSTLQKYSGEFNGSLRFFEAIAGMRIGDREQGGLGLTIGIANLTEESRERVADSSLETVRVDGFSACYAIGFTFDVTEQVTAGLGYRWATKIGVDGDYYKQSLSGESTTEPVATAGLRYRPTDALTFHASYVREGWDSVKSSLPAYPAGEGDEPGEGQWWDPFSKPISTVALGGELLLGSGKYGVMAGYSMELGADIDTAIVPENSIGFGGSVRFEQYVGYLAIVREQFAEGGESGQMTTYGIYASMGYEF
jgi:long-subunit fatty acid transport protein